MDRDRSSIGRTLGSLTTVVTGICGVSWMEVAPFKRDFSVEGMVEHRTTRGSVAGAYTGNSKYCQTRSLHWFTQMIGSTSTPVPGSGNAVITETDTWSFEQNTK